jgi:hypothetical protein
LAAVWLSRAVESCELTGDAIGIDDSMGFRAEDNTVTGFEGKCELDGLRSNWETGTESISRDVGEVNMPTSLKMLD